MLKEASLIFNNIQSIKTYRNAFDFARGIAILLVLFAHLDNYKILYLWPISMQPFQGFIGRLGVNIFFITSGFLIWHSGSNLVTRKPYGLKRYFINRFTRIFPLYLFNITLIAILSSFFIGYFKPEVSLHDFIRHIFFLQTFKPAIHENLNGVSWTLTYEMIFYMLVPALIYLRLTFKHFLISILLTQLIWFHYSEHLFGFVYYWTLFAFGILLCELNIRFNVLMSLFFIFLSFYLCMSYPQSRLPQFFFAFFIFNLIINFKYESKLFKPLVSTGVISYSLYLWHKILILLVIPYVDGTHFIFKPFNPWLPYGFTIEGLLMIVFIILFSWLSYLVIEKPSMTLLRKSLLRKFANA